MGPSFPPENWPQELVAATFAYLAIDDLRNLRRANKTLAALVAQSDFRKCYHTKHLDATPEGLREFVKMTQSGLLGTQVEHLVLTGIAVSTEHLEQIVKERARWVTEGNGPIFSSTQHRLSDEGVAKAQDDLGALRQRQMELHGFFESGTADGMLAKAFANIAAYGKHGKLTCLTLDMAVLQEDLATTKRPIETRAKSAVWQIAVALFRASIAGLAGSGLSTKKLDAFTDVWHCSLAWNALGCCVNELRGPKLEQSLSGLQSLSLSLSADSKVVSPENGSYTVATQQQSEGEGDYHSLADLLAMCPQLTHLHLHWFLLRSAIGKGGHAEKLLQQATNAGALRSLRGLTLRGVRFQGVTLLDLLKTAPLKELRLENVSITDPEPLPEDIDSESEPEADVRPTPRPPFDPIHSASWEAVFAHCSNHSANLSSIFFDDLWGSRLIHFKNSSSPQKMPWTPYTKDSATLERKGEDVRREIEDTYARGRPLGSPQQYRWRMGREREYGPA